MRKQGGFTLIELMIVIAILAILLAIAVPAYQDFTIRAKNTECVSVAAGAKLAASETFQSEGNFLNTGWSFAGSEYCDTIAISTTTGAITATTQDTGGPVVTFTFTPDTTVDGAITWECATSGGTGRQIPAECR